MQPAGPMLPVVVNVELHIATTFAESVCIESFASNPSREVSLSSVRIHLHLKPTLHYQCELEKYNQRVHYSRCSQ